MCHSLVKTFSTLKSLPQQCRTQKTEMNHEIHPTQHSPIRVPHYRFHAVSSCAGLGDIVGVARTNPTQL